MEDDYIDGSLHVVEIAYSCEGSHDDNVILLDKISKDVCIQKNICIFQSLGTFNSIG